jgi:hypothetical protein
MGHTILSIAEARCVTRMPDQYQGWVKLNDAAKFQEPGWVKLEPPVQHQAESTQAPSRRGAEIVGLHPRGHGADAVTRGVSTKRMSADVTRETFANALNALDSFCPTPARDRDQRRVNASQRSRLPPL